MPCASTSFPKQARVFPICGPQYSWIWISKYMVAHCYIQQTSRALAHANARFMSPYIGRAWGGPYSLACSALYAQVRSLFTGNLRSKFRLRLRNNNNNKSTLTPENFAAKSSKSKETGEFPPPKQQNSHREEVKDPSSFPPRRNREESSILRLEQEQILASASIFPKQHSPFRL